MLFAKPLDIEAIDYFFDTLLYSGSVLAVAGIQSQGAVARSVRETISSAA